MVMPAASPPPSRVPLLRVRRATWMPVGQGRAPAATDYPESEPLAPPLVTSRHVVEAAALRAVTLRAGRRLTLCPCWGF